MAFDLTEWILRRTIHIMMDAFNIGLAGMRAAEARVSIRAVNIVRAPIHDARSFTPVQTTVAAAPVVRAQVAQARGAPFDGLAEDMVDMRMAMHAYRASASVVRTASQMSRTLLDALT